MSKQIVWQVINFETPGNEHYATDYQVIASNVVLVMFKDGNQVKWRGLKEVVDNVGNKAIFIDLMQKNLREFMQESECSLPSALNENHK